MSVRLSVKLPYPPTVNHYYRRVGARTLISRQGRQYRRDVATLLGRPPHVPYVGCIDVCVSVFPPDRRRRDLDNVLKALLDALEHAGVYLDDSQIVRLTISKEEPREGGAAIVTIREHEGKVHVSTQSDRPVTGSH